MIGRVSGSGRGRELKGEKGGEGEGTRMRREYRSYDPSFGSWADWRVFQRITSNMLSTVVRADS